VIIRVSGSFLKLYHEETNKYAGLLVSPTLTRLIQEFSVTLFATLGSSQSQKNQEPRPISKEYPIQIVVYGFLTEKKLVGNLLSEGGLFLQHPYEYDTRVDYVNPQYLVRPGSRMPKIKAGAFPAGLRSISSPEEVLDDISKSQLLQVFNSATGPDLFSDVKPSPRLRASLQE
jgi:hypothetical protein